MTNEQEKYLKARSDLIKAFKSFNDLTEQLLERNNLWQLVEFYMK